MPHLSGTTVEVEKTKDRIYLAQAHRVPHLSGITVEVEKTKGRIYLAQTLRVSHLQVPLSMWRRPEAGRPVLGVRAISVFRSHCRGEEGKGAILTLPRPLNILN